MGGVESQGEPAPHGALEAAGFVAQLRLLKERSGLTYRQLERRAEARGDVLPRSTLADVLGGRSQPRPELLAAFVRGGASGGAVAAGLGPGLWPGGWGGGRRGRRRGRW
ncbi:helix-turn-helix domain-containing protein [Streptomyces lydicus]|uniref:helix-turn-helix domain-containing protein n=1 Tax=Streptomyces lydicus TaxID=47763 RepID=UPI0037AA7ED1